MFDTKIVLTIIIGIIVGSAVSYALISTQNNSQISSLQTQLSALTTQVNTLKSERDLVNANLNTIQKSLDEARATIKLLSSSFTPKKGDFLNYTLTFPMFQDTSPGNTLYTFTDPNADNLVNITSSNAFGINGGLFFPQWYLIDKNTRTVMNASVNLKESIGKPLMVWMQPSLRDVKAGSLLSIGSPKPPYLIISSKENLTMAGRSLTAWKAEYKTYTQPSTVAWWGEGSNQSSSFTVEDWQQNIGISCYQGNVTVELYKEKTNELVSRVEPSIVGWNPNIFTIYEPGSYYLKVEANPAVSWYVEFSHYNINLMVLGENSDIFKINSTKWDFIAGIGTEANISVYRAETNELVWNGSTLSGKVTLSGPGSFYIHASGADPNQYWVAMITPPLKPQVENEHYTAWYEASTGLMLKFTVYKLPDRQVLGRPIGQELLLAYELKNSNIFGP